MKVLSDMYLLNVSHQAGSRLVKGSYAYSDDNDQINTSEVKKKYDFHEDGVNFTFKVFLHVCICKHDSICRSEIIYFSKKIFI